MNNNKTKRRTVALVAASAALCVTSSSSFSAPFAFALEANEQTDSQFVQNLLQKTNEKKEERAKERLEEYSKKNFKDYLAFVDNGRAARTENDVKIKEWLEKNK